MKKKILVGAAVGTAGLVALTGATFAHEGGGPDGDVRDRVAEILGIAPEELQGAFEQARDEQREEQIAERLANAVEQGVITQEEADSISDWLDAMPEALDGVMGYGKRQSFGHIIGAAGSEERISAMLDRLVQAGKLDQADVDEVAAWIADAPVEALQKLGQHGGDGDGDGPQFHRGFQGRMFGEGPGGRLFEGRFHIRPYAPPAEAGDDGNTDVVYPVAVGESA